MYERYIKRLIDLSVATVMIVILAPLMFVVSIAIVVNLGFPVIFKQQRPGKDGVVFNIYKFRSMSNKKDAEGNLLPNAERVSDFGGFLRRSSLDELPGLFNVLLGQVALVGPRPLRVAYLERYNKHHARRHEILPGITGLAQVSGRNSLSWVEKFDKDIEYVDNISFFMDVKILLLTVVKVLKRDGVDSSQDSTGMTEFLGYPPEDTGRDQL